MKKILLALTLCAFLGGVSIAATTYTAGTEVVDSKEKKEKKKKSKKSEKKSEAKKESCTKGKSSCCSKGKKAEEKK